MSLKHPEFWQWVPFIGLAINSREKPHPLSVRLLEAAIIAAVTGALTSWATIQVLGNDIAWIKANMQQYNTRIERLEGVYIMKDVPPSIPNR